MQSDWCTDMLYTRVWAPVFLLKGSRCHFSRGLQGMQIFRSRNKHTKLQVDFCLASFSLVSSYFVLAFGIIHNAEDSEKRGRPGLIHHVSGPRVE